MNAADEATKQCVQTLPGAVVPQVASEWLLLYVTIQIVTWTNLQKFGVVTWKTLPNHTTGKGWAFARKWVLAWVQYNLSHGFSL